MWPWPFTLEITSMSGFSARQVSTTSSTGVQAPRLLTSQPFSLSRSSMYTMFHMWESEGTVATMARLLLAGSRRHRFPGACVAHFLTFASNGWSLVGLRGPLADREQRAALARERLVDAVLGLDHAGAVREVAALVVLEHAVEHEHQLGAAVLVEIAVRARPEAQQEGCSPVGTAAEERNEVDSVTAVLHPRLPVRSSRLKPSPIRSVYHQLSGNLADG